MGCDIHLYTEAKKTVRSETEWHNSDNWVYDPYEKKFGHKSVYGGRDYELFGTLADVRNRHENPVISPPRDTPTDMHHLTLKEREYWEGDGHSHSWFTLKELKDFHKDHTIFKHQGLVENSHAAECKEKGITPHSWCQGASNEEKYTFMEWEGESSLGDLIKLLEERMKEYFWIYQDNYDSKFDEKFRIVFWFDN